MTRILISECDRRSCPQSDWGDAGERLAIPAEAGEHIFERFHRGAVGENVPGHGIGLNLARELARLHGGDVRLVRSGPDRTDFELRLRRAPAGEPPAP